MKDHNGSAPVFYDAALDGARFFRPVSGPMQCSESTCHVNATHRDSEAYPWCDDHGTPFQPATTTKGHATA